MDSEMSGQSKVYFAKLNAGFCPHCDTKIEVEKLIDGRAYVLPCYHMVSRVGNNRAKRKRWFYEQ